MAASVNPVPNNFEYFENDYFSFEELKCRCGCNTYRFDKDFLLKLIALREQFGSAMSVSSGYRCENHPAEAHKPQNRRPGVHQMSKAVDILIDGESAYKLLSLTILSGFRVGVSQKSGESKYIHIDCLNSAIDGDRFSTQLWTY